MNIFITGAKGFVGTHLKEYINKHYQNYKIFSPSSKELDLTHEEAVDNFILSNKIDIIIHLANKGGSRDKCDMKNITEYNLRIFFNIVKHERNVKKIISFGSGAEYGKHKPIINAKEEDYLEAFPLDEYGFYKSITSKYIQRSENIIQLRIFGCYGEHENYRFRFISNAIVKNLLHLPITINKNVYFDYMYIDDLVKMVDFFIHNNSKEKVFNASTGAKIDLVTLANLINEVSDFKSEIHVLNKGLSNEYSSNNDRIKGILKDFTFTEHKEAILKMRTHFLSNLELLDQEIIINDPYIKAIDKQWKDK